MKRFITLIAVLMCGFSGIACAQQSVTAASSSASAATGKTHETKAAAKGATKNGAMVDINSATAKELAALPKIGDAKAKAIVDGRPWSGKDDLVAKNILTQSEYDAIKDMIIAKQAGKGANAKGEKKQKHN